jgi:hypothetical protein
VGAAFAGILRAMTGAAAVETVVTRKLLRLCPRAVRSSDIEILLRRTF